MTEFTKVLLSTVEINRNNEREDEITVLNREVLEDIIFNLDLDELAYKAYEKALGYSSFSGSIDVEIDARDGEISMGWSQNNTMTIGYYNTYINLFSVQTGNNNDDLLPDEEIYWFTEDEHINYFKELKERNYRIEDGEEEGEILDEYEIRDAVIEKFDLDYDKLQEEYFRIASAEMLNYLHDIDNVNNQLDELYSNIVAE